MWVIRERKAYPMTHVSDLDNWVVISTTMENSIGATSNNKEKNTLHFRHIDYEVSTGYPSEDSSRLLEILIWNSLRRKACMYWSSSLRKSPLWRRQWEHKSKWDHPVRDYKVRRKKDKGWSFCKVVFSWIMRNGKSMSVTVCTDTYMTPKVFPQLKVHSGSYSGPHDTFKL